MLLHKLREALLRVLQAPREEREIPVKDNNTSSRISALEAQEPSPRHQQHQIYSKISPQGETVRGWRTDHSLRQKA